MSTARTNAPTRTTGNCAGATEMFESISQERT